MADLTAEVAASHRLAPHQTGASASEKRDPRALAGESPLHLVAEAHEPKFSVAFRYAFARGRQAVKKSQNLSTVAARATGAIADTLDEVLPKMLHAVAADGGEVGADLVNRRFRAMAHAHATTQVNLPPEVAAQMAAFPIDEADLAEQGREHDSHITVKYGVHGSPNDVREALAGETLAEATMGKTIVFEGVEDGTADAVVVEIHSDCLRRWNKKINESVDSIENSYDYKPHATIAYVKPGLGQKYAGDSRFEGMPLSFDRLVYSSKDDQMVSIPLVASTELRAAKRDVWTTGFGMSFNSQNPPVIEWAKKHAAELIEQITETTRERIREAVVGLQEDGDWDVAYDKILNAVGDETRADLIARHETMLAAGEGQRLAWEQAEDQGLLSGRERREWIITEDERVCPICAQLAGAIAPLHGTYPGGIDGPPAHVQCRCTEGIIG